MKQDSTATYQLSNRIMTESPQKLLMEEQEGVKRWKVICRELTRLPEDTYESIYSLVPLVFGHSQKYLLIATSHSATIEDFDWEQ